MIVFCFIRYVTLLITKIRNPTHIILDKVYTEKSTNEREKEILMMFCIRDTYAKHQHYETLTKFHTGYLGSKVLQETFG